MLTQTQIVVMVSRKVALCSRDNLHVPQIPKDLSRCGSLNLTHAHIPEHITSTVFYIKKDVMET
jgi:hypothetical protein